MHTYPDFADFANYVQTLQSYVQTLQTYVRTLQTYADLVDFANYVQTLQSYVQTFDLCSDFADLCSDFAELCSDFAELCLHFADLCSDFADSCSNFADLCSDFVDSCFVRSLAEGTAAHQHTTDYSVPDHRSHSQPVLGDIFAYIFPRLLPNNVPLSRRPEDRFNVFRDVLSLSSSEATLWAFPGLSFFKQ